MTIYVVDYLPNDRSVAWLTTGYVAIETGAEKRYAPLHATIVISDKNGTEPCQLVEGDVLIVHKDVARSGCLSVQVAKERTTSLMA
jgi:hypothetical protein